MALNKESLYQGSNSLDGQIFENFWEFQSKIWRNSFLALAFGVKVKMHITEGVRNLNPRITFTEKSFG